MPRFSTDPTSTTPGARRSAFRSIQMVGRPYRPGLPLVGCKTGSTSSMRLWRIQRLARKLYAFFRLRIRLAAGGACAAVGRRLLRQRVVGTLLNSAEFQDPTHYFTRYSWPVEFVVRLMKSVGWTGYSAAAAVAPLANMGQILFEPPDVSGWRLGTSWFSTGTLLARMNFASSLAANQQFSLGAAATPQAGTPQALVAYMVDRLEPAVYDSQVEADLLDYANAGGVWTGSPTQVRAKAAGLAHLIGGSSEYQFV